MPQTAQVLRDGRPAAAKVARRSVLFAAVAQAIGGAVLWRLHLGLVTGWIRPIPAAVSVALWLWALALVLAVFVAPAAAARLYSAWTSLALAIGLAITTAMFTVLFAVLLPFFLFVRLQDPLRKRLGGDSYWEDRTPDEDSLDRARQPY